MKMSELEDKIEELKEEAIEERLDALTKDDFNGWVDGLANNMDIGNFTYTHLRYL